MPDDLTGDQRWQWRASLIADLTGMDDAWFEFDSPTDRAYLGMIADGLIEVGWRFGGVPRKAAPPTLAETRTGTDWCPNCREEVGTNRVRDDGGTERCATCWSELAEQSSKPCDGATLIALERDRQIAKGWNANHDDRHPGNQLVQAALFYANETASGTEWPWDTLPTRGTRIRDLERAGALIAAEIDRLHRAAGQS